MEKIREFYDWIDDKVGPDRDKHPRACHEGREMILECVLESDCFKVNLSISKK